MTPSPLVSIIIPTFNRAYLIGETLDSVIAQTYQNWECIVVDDGSTDNTAEVLAEYIAKDSRIQFHHRPPEHKPGGNGARNYGFKLSKGEYVQWFDSDDIMLKGFLELKMKEIKKENGDVVFCAYNYFDYHGMQKRISNAEFRGNILSDSVYLKINFSPLSFLLKKSIVNVKFDEELRRAQDADFFLKLFAQDRKLNIGHIPKPLFLVRKHEKSISSENTNSVMILSRMKVNRRFLKYYLFINNKRGVSKFQALFLKGIRRLLINNYFTEALKQTWRAKELPTQKKMWVLSMIITYRITRKGLYRIK